MDLNMSWSESIDPPITGPWAQRPKLLTMAPTAIAKQDFLCTTYGGLSNSPGVSHSNQNK